MAVEIQFDGNWIIFSGPMEQVDKATEHVRKMFEFHQGVVEH